MQFRFTIFHEVLYPLGQLVDEPTGWKDAALTLERHEDFHSLVEYFNGEFIWHGTARDVLKDIEINYGADAKARILIEVSTITGEWDTLFDGLIPISDFEEISKDKFYKLKAPIIRDDFWSKFINRRETPVTLTDSEDVDGDARTPVAKVQTPLPSQVIKQNFIRETGYNTSEADADFLPADFGNFTVGEKYYFFFHNAFQTLDEIKERFDYGNAISDVDPYEDKLYYFKVQYEGTYKLNLRIRYLITLVAVTPQFTFTWYYRIRRGNAVYPPVQIGSTRSGQYNPVTGIKDLDDHNLVDEVLNMKAGDELYIYGEFRLTGSGATLSAYYSDYNDALVGFDPIYTEMSLEADTVFPETTTDSYLLKDSFESILSKVTGQDSVVVSNLLDTCKGNYILALGLHLRGYSMDEKQFAISFNDLWDGADPAFNLGLGYVDGANQIQIEEKSYFYDKDPVINIGGISNITRIYHDDYFFKTLEIGFDTWSLESASGIDDTQTRRKFRTKFKTVGKDKKILSKFLAAGLALEQIRRQRVEEGKDFKGDDNICIIAVKSDGQGGWTPEVGSDFTSTLNILNAATRYNLRLGAAWNLERWLDWLSGCMAHFPDKYYFASGEGNYQGTVTRAVNDCDGAGGSIVENQDFSIDATNYIKLTRRYQFEHPMTFDEFNIIRQNRHKAIGLSRSNAFYTPHFIQKMEYNPFHGKATFVVDLAVIPSEINGFKYLESDDFVIFGTEGLLYQDGEEVLFSDNETALVGLDT